MEYQCFSDMRSHMGAMLIFRRGIVFSLLSNKQKFNLTSSTVVDIIGVDDALNFVMQVKLFIEKQVVNLPVKLIIKKLEAKPSVLQQDNKPAPCVSKQMEKDLVQREQ